MLAPSAGTLPRGHLLIEPYLFDVGLRGHFNRDGTRRHVPRADTFGSLTYALFGLADQLTVGALPIVGYTVTSDGPNSSGVALGDLGVLAQYRLAQFRPCRWLPTTSVNVQETLPTGKYDRLGDRPSDGFGGGAYSTTLSIYMQTYFWLAHGRIVRMRVNISEALPSGANVEDVSVYGTEKGFRGRAQPGNSFIIDAAWEYSVTRSWVVAFETVYQREGQTHVIGREIGDPALSPIQLDDSASQTLGFAPAIEFSWKRNLGVLFGVRLIVAGRNTAFTITPAVAINYVH